MFGPDGIEWDVYLSQITDKSNLLESSEYVNPNDKIAIISRKFHYNRLEGRINIEKIYLLPFDFVEHIVSQPIESVKQERFWRRLLNRMNAK